MRTTGGMGAKNIIFCVRTTRMTPLHTTAHLYEQKPEL